MLEHSTPLTAQQNPGELATAQRRTGRRSRSVQRVPSSSLVVGPADDPLEREADAVAERVVASTRAPFATESAKHTTRIRLRSEPESPARTIRRALATVAGDAEADVVTAHLALPQDTGRTFIQEVELLYRINEISATRDADLAKMCGAVVKNKSGSDPVALRTAINALADKVNPMVPALMEELSAARDNYSDISDALRSHFSGNQIVIGLDQKLLESCASKIRQATFKEDPLLFVKEIHAFKVWLKDQAYGYVYDEFVQSNAKEVAEDKAPAELVASPGIVTLAQMRTVAPNGLTAGQRYTPDRTFGAFRYHVSVSFKIIDTKANLKLSPTKKQVEIEKFHVSFEPNVGGAKTYYWWKRAGKKGAYVFDTVAGPPGTTAMKDRAVQAVQDAAPKVNCTA